MHVYVIVEAAVQNLDLVKLNNSEVMATWDINPALFELKNFIVTYFLEHEEKEIATITIDATAYQISDLIPGWTYAVCVTAQYAGTANNKILPAVSTEGIVTLDPIGTYINVHVVATQLVLFVFRYN